MSNFPPPPPGAPDPDPKKSNTTKGVLIGLGACLGLFVLVVVAGLLMGDDSDEATAGAPTTTTTEAPEPEPTTTAEAPDTLVEHQVQAWGDSQLLVTTDELDPGKLEAILVAIREQHRDGDEWFVTFACASAPSTPEHTATTATGRFANTRLGLARTGLSSFDEYRFESVGRADCLPPPTTTALAASSVSADQILAAFAAAGLNPPNPRDNTHGCDEDIPCTKRITTDVLTIDEWQTPEAAQRWVDAAIGDAAVLVGPTTTVRFTTGGSTPAYDRAAYEAVLAGLS